MDTRTNRKIHVIEAAGENFFHALPQLLRDPKTLIATPAAAQSISARTDVPDAAQLALTTSGSTGEAKIVYLSRAALEHSARATLEHLVAATGPDSATWLLALPHQHIAGFQVLNRARLAGHRVAFHPETSFTPESFLAICQAITTPAKYTALVPTQLYRLLADSHASEMLATFDAVLVGGAKLAPTLRAQAEAAGVCLVHTYGMSETAGGCVYDGVALPGVQWRLDESGRIWLRGPVLAEQLELDRHGWWQTGDVGETDVGATNVGATNVSTKDTAGRLVVTGRADDIIISGGLNIHPGTLTDKLLELPTAREVLAAGISDPQWGEVVGVVICSDIKPTYSQVAELSSSLGERAYLPKRILWTQHLPLLGNGKVDRRKIIDILREKPETWESISKS